MFEAVKNKFINVKNDIVSAVYSPPTESRFYEEGKLTPTEFLTSGDSLISLCPQWRWMPASEEKYTNKYLPPQRQYLLMEKVPCDQRVRELLDALSLVEQEVDDEYVINESSKKEDADISAKIGSLRVKDHFSNETESEEHKNNAIQNNLQNLDDNLVVVDAPIERRYYDLSIIYDLVHYTPHLFLSGVDEDNLPLKQSELFEDIVSHYSNKTVTFELMPQTGIIQASLHPCKHAAVIKHMIDNIQQAGGTIRSHQCLFIFLKFLQSVIPTIQYDIAGEILFDE